MKTGKKVMILLLVFVAAAVVYFVHPVGKKEEHGVTEYTAMEKAKFPVLYATMGEREMAPVFGQTDERGVTAGRDSLILLPEDRKLKLRFAGTTKIQGVHYEIRSLDTEDLIERTRIGSFETSLNGDSENAFRSRTFWMQERNICSGYVQNSLMDPRPGTICGSRNRTRDMRMRCCRWRRTFLQKLISIVMPRV